MAMSVILAENDNIRVVQTSEMHPVYYEVRRRGRGVEYRYAGSQPSTATVYMDDREICTIHDYGTGEVQVHYPETVDISVEDGQPVVEPATYHTTRGTLVAKVHEMVQLLVDVRDGVYDYDEEDYASL